MPIVTNFSFSLAIQYYNIFRFGPRTMRVHFFSVQTLLHMLMEEVLTVRFRKRLCFSRICGKIFYMAVLFTHSPKWSQFEIIVILIINWVSFVILVSSGCRGRCGSSVEWQIKLTALAAHVQVIWASVQETGVWRSRGGRGNRGRLLA